MCKTLIKMSGIISVLFACLYTCIFVFIHLAIPYIYLVNSSYDYFILLIIVLMSLISAFGGIIFLHYKDLSNEELKKKKNIILMWSLYFVITSGISGILGLVAYACLCNSDNHSNIKIDYIEEIKELESLMKKGLITQEEFALKKKKILDI